ncbi:MAG: FemAB family PEP-CTERM system-associated protein [Planctomycetes bacterium]|nr:FemAB family PEP-CTERM system-associated protein [Planctomycetota bacterium]
MTSSEVQQMPAGLRNEPTISVARARVADEAEMEAWVLASPRTCFWHLPAWMRAVRAVFPIEDCSLLARRGGRVVGVLPLGLCETLTLGQNLISVPYGVYGGPAGDDETVEMALFEYAKTMAEKERVGCLELRQRDRRIQGLPESDLYVTFEKALPATPDETLQQLPRKARAAARQARDKYQLTFDEGMWFIDDFYALFSRNKHHLGSPPLPKAFFEQLRDEFAGSIYLHIVRHNIKPIGGVMSFKFGDRLLPYYSGGIAEYEHMQCNNFLYWKLMEWGVERGFRSFDFGRSRRDSGPFHFKRNQGFEPQSLHYAYHLVRNREIPRFNPSNPAFDLPRRMWQRLPMPLHEWLGGKLSRFLP